MTIEAASDPTVSRLLRWYPRIWRERYGEEFGELLRAEIDEQPQSWRRDVDVRWHGVKAQLGVVGLGRQPLRDSDAIRMVKAVSLVSFIGCLLSLWSQILRGSDWPTEYALPPSVLAMCIVPAMTFAVIGVHALKWISSLARRMWRARSSGQGRALVPALLTGGIGVALLSAGLVMVWSTTLHRGITPTSVTMLVTESISTFWLHPHLLGQVPDAQIAWMVMSPIAVALIVAGSVELHRTLDQVAPVGRSRVGWAAWHPGLLAPALLASTWWVISSQHLRLLSLRTGTLDIAMIVAMTSSLAVLARTNEPHRFGYSCL
ncbi:MAG TPA: hypothetical protein VHV75_12845 [Solirubrobacteraceae bacterium]|jgi:hypothetical protein|nr:hypothetical protein [Solirubrobacteraceae bacterium]